MNKTPKKFEEIKVGDHYTLSKKFSQKRLEEFARVTGDINPFHLDQSYAKKRGFSKRIVHGLLIASIGSEIASQHFPGPGTILVRMNIRFFRPLFVNEVIRVTNRVVRKDRERGQIITKSVGKKRNGKVVFTSEETMVPPKNPSF